MEKRQTLGDVIQFTFTNNEGKRYVGGIDYEQIQDIIKFTNKLIDKIPSETEKKDIYTKFNDILLRNLWYGGN